MLTRKPNFSALYDHFAWEVPEHYNIGYDICDKWADQDPDRLAILDLGQNGISKQVTFGALKVQSNQLANALLNAGLTGPSTKRGDRIGVLLPQCSETAITHIAAAKMGCISIPLFTQFGPDALLHRLQDSSAKAVVTNSEGLKKIDGIMDHLPALRVVLCIDGPQRTATDFYDFCTGQSKTFEIAATKADDPAILIYTSGTTGQPKGALHAHRVLLGHLPGVEMSHNFLPQSDDRIWTPADWAWIGGLLDVLMPALHHGVPVVAHRFQKFDPEQAFNLLKSHKVQNVFLPPTAIKLMKQHPNPQAFQLNLRSVGSGGESLGAELLEWGKSVFGTTINEFYGQTECNMIVSACCDLEAPKQGSMGRAVPGHVVDIIDQDTGVRLDPDQEGAIAVLAPDPVMFLEYWNMPQQTNEKFVEGPDGTWLITGDRGRRDKDGHFFFIGRDDDIISSAGYRIGPTEIEDCLIAHEAVQLAGAVGMPDPVRGSIVAAYIVLKPEFSPSIELEEEIAHHVRVKLAAHEYPRVIRFIQNMPLTTTGKIIRAELRKWAEDEAQKTSGANND